MKTLVSWADRAEYIAAQIDRSEAKFGYCKVSIKDTLKYRQLLPDAFGPILCLGTRNGREVDLFRAAFFGPPWQTALVRQLEVRRNSYRSRLPGIENLGQSDLRHITPTSAIGAEINPRGGRRDIWVGSFDEMPEEWEGRFGVVYSNSFDQSQDPERTAREWKRVTRSGGYLIVTYVPGQVPNAHDPVGDLSTADLVSLFDLPLVSETDQGSENRYSELVFRRP